MTALYLRNQMKTNKQTNSQIKTKPKKTQEVRQLGNCVPYCFFSKCILFGIRYSLDEGVCVEGKECLSYDLIFKKLVSQIR